MSLRSALLASFAVVCGVFLIGAGSSFVAGLLAEDHFYMADVDGKFAQLTTEARLALQNARRAEKDLLIARRESDYEEVRARYGTLTRSFLAEAREALEGVRQLALAHPGDPTHEKFAESAREVERLLGEYEYDFLAAVDLYGQLGYGPQGLAGKLAATGRVVETLITDPKQTSLQLALAQVRLKEKNLQMRGAALEQAGLARAIGALRTSLDAARLPAHTRYTAERLIEDYESLTAQYIATEKAIDEDEAALRTTAGAAEVKLRDLREAVLAEAGRRRHEAETLIHAILFIIPATAALALALAAAVAAFTMKSITVGVQRILAFTQSVSQGELTVRLKPSGQQEFVQLADGLNAMTTALQWNLETTQEQRAALAEANLSLQQEVAERERAERDVRDLNTGLERRVAERTLEVEAANRDLSRHNEEMHLLTELNHTLLAALSLEEAQRIIERFCPRIFRGTAGRLFLLNNSRDRLEAVAAWGKPRSEDPYFAPHDCWALRRGHVHVVATPDTALTCGHVLVGGPDAPPYLCAPMIAQGEVLGSIYLEAQAAEQSSERASIAPSLQAYAGTVAEQIALALANLKLRETLRQRSIRDPLTGLFNRGYLEESLLREIDRCRRKGLPLTVVMLDVDHFKRVNDTFGHNCGDTVLRRLGSLLGQSLRGADVACRYGGEEFTLLLPECALEAALRRAEEIRIAARALEIVYEGIAVGTVTVSLGVAIYPEHGKDSTTLLHAADAALYQAKRAGRDRVVAAAGAPLTA